jgi:hypothetical protein
MVRDYERRHLQSEGDPALSPVLLRGELGRNAVDLHGAASPFSSKTHGIFHLYNKKITVSDPDWIRIHLGLRIRIRDPDPSRPKFSPKKRKNEEILCFMFEGLK